MPPGAIPFPFGICRVCKDKATGVHYGVATCEGCKGFFKRTITRGDKYKCFFGGSCDIVPKNRNRCKSCRFRRCLETGMSVEAVRMGRIPKVEKEKALEVFQQTGSDFNKMEILVQHSGAGKPDATAVTEDGLGPGGSGKDDSSVNRTCTIHVSISNDRAIKQEEVEGMAIDGEPQLEIDNGTGVEFDSLTMDQGSPVDIKPPTSDSMLELARKSRIGTEGFARDAYSGMSSYNNKSMNRSPQGHSGVNRDGFQAEHGQSDVNRDGFRAEHIPATHVPQTSQPQSHLLEHDTDLDVKSFSTVNCAKSGTGVPLFAQFTALNESRAEVVNTNPGPRISVREPESMNSSMVPSSRNPGMDPHSQNPGNNPSSINSGINSSSQVQGMDHRARNPDMNPRFRNPSMVPGSRYPGNGLGPGSRNPGINPGPRNLGMDPGARSRNPGMNPIPRNHGMDPNPRSQGMNPGPRNQGMDPSPRNQGMDPCPRNQGMDPGPRNLGMDPVLKIPSMNSRFRNPEMESPSSRNSSMNLGTRNIGINDPRSRIPGMGVGSELHDVNHSANYHNMNIHPRVPNMNPNSRIPNYDPSSRLPDMDPTNSGIDPNPRTLSMGLGSRNEDDMLKSMNPSVNPSFAQQHVRKMGSIEVSSAPSMNWTHTPKTGDSNSHSHYVGDFSDNFDIDHLMTTSALTMKSQPLHMGTDTTCQFTTSGAMSGPNHQLASIGGGSVSVSNPWTYNESFQADLTGTSNAFMSQGGSGESQHYLPPKKQRHRDFTVPTTEFQQAHDDIQGLAQLCVQDNSKRTISSESSVNPIQTSCNSNISPSYHDNDNGQLVTSQPGTSAWPSGSQLPVVINTSVGHPLPPETPSSIVSSGSSRYSSQWSRYSPSLLKVLIEHILESREEKSIIDRLKNKFNSSNSANSTVQMFLKLVDDTVSNKKTSDQMSTSSSFSLLQQTKTNKTDHMQKFLSDVESFMKTEAQSSGSQHTASMNTDHQPMTPEPNNTFSSSHITDALQSPNPAPRRNSDRRSSCDTSNNGQEVGSSNNSQFSAEMLSDSVSMRFHKKLKTEAAADVVSSSFLMEDEEETDIKLTLECMELAKDILYRLKPEHRQKLRLHKTGKIQLRIMTDSDEDVEEVYSKIFQSIPQLNERVIGFCDNVRGFLDLPVTDKGILQKRAFYDIWMLTYAEYFYDGESHIILSTGELYSTGAMRRILNDKMVDTFLDFSKEFNSLKLSDVEISILCAIQLTSHALLAHPQERWIVNDKMVDTFLDFSKEFNSLKLSDVEISILCAIQLTSHDGLALEDQSSVQRLHSHLIDVFDWEIKRNHGNQHSRLLLQIFKLMPTLAVINRLQQEIIASYPANRFKGKGNKESPDDAANEKSEEAVEDRDGASMST